MTRKLLSSCSRMISPSSLSCRGVNKSLARSGAGVTKGGQFDWASAPEARKKIAKRRVHRIEFENGVHSTPLVFRRAVENAFQRPAKHEGETDAVGLAAR